MTLQRSERARLHARRSAAPLVLNCQVRVQVRLLVGHDDVGRPRSPQTCDAIVDRYRTLRPGESRPSIESPSRMFFRRLISLIALSVFLASGGLTGHARVDLCIDADGTVEIESAFDRCCDESGHVRADVGNFGKAPVELTASSADCVTCSELPLGTGELKPSAPRDLKVDLAIPHPLSVLIPALLLPPKPKVALATPASLRFPASTPTHESVPVTIIRC